MSSTTSFLELIETLWNVNQSHLEAPAFFVCELIETLWNVNYKT